jgi:toxin ParE1/3/4
MARVVKRPEALNDLEEIQVAIGRNSMMAAERFLIAAERAFELLASMPELGGRSESAHPILSKLRIWPIHRFRKYLILYRPLANGIEVVRVVHGARDIEALFRIQE